MEPSVTRQIPATVHGRYLIRPATADCRGLIFGFHGYGTNAEHLLEEMAAIPGISDWTLVAVQALHPFYNTKTREVVASWMTKLDRELAIGDNIRYVRGVVEQVQQETGVEGPLVYVGFSQGVAMAYRAAAGAGHPSLGLIALGGDVPPELAERNLDGFPPVLIGRGNREDWYSQDQLEADVAVLTAKGVEVETCVYTGGHEWTNEFRLRCTEYLNQLGT
ncbi:MAG: phospholipase [Thermoanaerobaculia bacterium]